jgi:hypothetical protein
MKPHLAVAEFVAFRQHHIVEAEPGANRGRFKMLAVFFGRQAHGKNKLLQHFALHHGASGLRAEMFSAPVKPANLA